MTIKIPTIYTEKELRKRVSVAIKSLRVSKNITQKVLADYSGVGINTLRQLEAGGNASMDTLLSVLIVLDKADWVLSLEPSTSVNPLRMVNGKNRIRAHVGNIVNKEKLYKKRAILKKYGLTLNQYLWMFNFQDGKCGNPGCDTPLDINSRNTHIDHDHNTGKVRSLLCARCNSSLGLLDENNKRIEGLSQYLKRHNN